MASTSDRAMTIQLGLTSDQLAERRLRLHAGDAAAIMAGDYRKVYRRIKGIDPEDDLSDEFRVQLGSYTEPFNLAWTMRKTGRQVEYFSANELLSDIWCDLTGRPDLFHATELVVSSQYSWMACNLDGMTTTPQGHRAVIDAKHVGRSTEAEILRYTPAGVWQATCAGTDWWGLSMIVGNKWEEPIFQEVDEIYQATLIARSRECWGYIERNEEPPELASVLPPKPQARLRTVVIEGGDVDPDTGIWTPPHDDRHQPWPNWGSDFARSLATVIRTEAAHTANNIARAAIKELLPEDVGEVRRGDTVVKRDKAGAIRFTLPKGDE